MRYLHKIFLSFLLCLAYTPLFAADLQVPAGSTWAINGASMAAGAYNLEIAGNLVITSGDISVLSVTIAPGGKLIAGSGLIQVAGNWSNNGTFTAGTSRVEFIDGGPSLATLSGSTTFYDLSFISSTGKTFRLSPSSQFVINHDLLVHGIAGLPVVLAPTQPGIIVTIRVHGGTNQQYTTWQDIVIQQGPVVLPVSIPTLNTWGLYLLILLLTAIVLQFQHHRNSCLFEDQSCKN
jgi:hypothetical protein